jgi:hypothetical protein
MFQSHQKSLEWRRQIMFDKATHDLNKVRECLKEFVFAASFTAEAIERILPFFKKQNVTSDEYNEFTTSIINMQNERFRQNSKVISLVIYLENSDVIQKSIDAYVASTTNYIRHGAEYVYLKYCLSNEKECNSELETNLIKEKIRLNAIRLQDLLDINQKFKTVIDKIKNELQNQGEKYESFRF